MTEENGQGLAASILVQGLAKLLITKGVIDKSDWLQCVKEASEFQRGQTITNAERKAAEKILRQIYAGLSPQK